MANEIKDKYSTSAALTITLASLASSTAGVGRQSTIIDNSSTRYGRLIIYVKVTTGTTPTANRTFKIYGIRTDADATTKHRSDGAGASDAGLTVKNCILLGVIFIDANTSDKAYYGEFIFDSPGPEWGIALTHDTGVNLNSSDSNHWIRYVGINPEVQ